MKIRTGFVSNSSSSSFIFRIIDSSKTKEILDSLNDDTMDDWEDDDSFVEPLKNNLYESNFDYYGQTIIDYMIKNPSKDICLSSFYIVNIGYNNENRANILTQLEEENLIESIDEN